MSKLRQQYDRLKVISLEEGFRLIAAGESPVTIDGAPVNIGNETGPSVRLLTFLHHGVKCNDPECRLEGTYFAIERGACDAGKFHRGKPKPYHLNLWGTGNDGSEMLFTCDHVLARALGGAHDISNTQTLCFRHNSKKSEGESKEAARRIKLAKLAAMAATA